MNPIIFDKTDTDFTTNGLGRLECISCFVTEERNGMYELEGETFLSAKNADKLEMDMIIAVKTPNRNEIEPFRIYKITKPISGTISFYAQHISYQLSYIPVMPFNISDSQNIRQATMDALKTNAAEICPFNFTANQTGTGTYAIAAPISIRSALGGQEGSVLETFGGEYEWRGYDVILHEFRGVTTPQVTLNYGKNITDLTQEEYISNVVTGIAPYWKYADGAMITLPEKVVESQHADNYAFRRTIAMDLSESINGTPTVEMLRAKAQAIINQTGIGIPTVSINVSFVDLAKTVEYKDIAPFMSLHLCDHINVYFEKLGIQTTAQVVKYKYNVLLEQYDNIDVGTSPENLVDTIKSTEGLITTLAKQTTYEVDNATAWLTGSNGYVVARKDNDGNWKELLFLDRANIATAQTVLRINENGIGFSSTGVNGPYTQAWTLDGKLVIGGTNAPSLTVYEVVDGVSTGNVLFQIDKDGLEWDAVYSSMTKSGILRATNAEITSVGGLSKIKIDNGSINCYYNDIKCNEISMDDAFEGAVSGSGLVISGNIIGIDGQIVVKDGDVWLASTGKKNVALANEDTTFVTEMSVEYQTITLGENKEAGGFTRSTTFRAQVTDTDPRGQTTVSEVWKSVSIMIPTYSYVSQHGLSYVTTTNGFVL